MVKYTSVSGRERFSDDEYESPVPKGWKPPEAPAETAAVRDAYNRGHAAGYLLGRKPAPAAAPAKARDEGLGPVFVLGLAAGALAFGVLVPLAGWLGSVLAGWWLS